RRGSSAGCGRRGSRHGCRRVSSRPRATYEEAFLRIEPEAGKAAVERAPPQTTLSLTGCHADVDTVWVDVPLVLRVEEGEPPALDVEIEDGRAVRKPGRIRRCLAVAAVAECVEPR